MTPSDKDLINNPIKCDCGELAVEEVSVNGCEWQPMCPNCLQDDEAKYQDVVDHELKHFGGVYGIPHRETRPIPSLVSQLTKALTELKQLRADKEISESTQAALYESLLIIQRKYTKLRAERSNLITWLDGTLIMDERAKLTNALTEHGEGYMEAIRVIKSKLTDSAQSGEGE